MLVAMPTGPRVLSVAAASLVVASCVFDWDKLDRRLAGATGGAAGAGGVGGRDPSSSSQGGTGGASSGGSGPGGAGSGGGTLIFADEFDSPNPVWTSFQGNWLVTGGEMQQTDDAESLTFNWVSTMGSLTDYRIVTEMRQLTNPFDGAIETIFRINPASPQQTYFCNWEPSTGAFLVMSQDVGPTTNVIDVVTINTANIPNYTATMPVTMELTAIGSTIHCWLHEIPGADLTVTDTTYSSGSFGFKTYRIGAAYEYIHVYAE